MRISRETRGKVFFFLSKSTTRSVPSQPRAVVSHESYLRRFVCHDYSTLHTLYYAYAGWLYFYSLSLPWNYAAISLLIDSNERARHGSSREGRGNQPPLLIQPFRLFPPPFLCVCDRRRRKLATLKVQIKLLLGWIRPNKFRVKKYRSRRFVERKFDTENVYRYIIRNRITKWISYV